ncbi:uncharacterized protein F5891DRAFT_636516 [Suillus fuscotomentosus]|uniref:Uncharacterized protein n=1 Tax=Suillus fuscotomentosus TaxID=1912939 RepID=A0AAD4HRL8_9AGAM|nr:uncharacterized protein F5891DRAFT_636516 [Suillus fuscotomentosus]KAG1906011.1 hypothetical protein F5891DRAFT_636516 [Suillus fuscotomentosus]
MSETDVNPVLDRAREWRKGKKKNLGDDEDNKPISSPFSLSREGNSPIQIRPLVLTSAASFHSVPDCPLKSFRSEGEEQTMPPSSSHETPPLTSSASQDSPEVETREADVTPVRVDEDNFAHLNYTAMKIPRPPGAWTTTPVLLKHNPRVSSPPPVSSGLILTPSSTLWTSLSRANSRLERCSKPEAPAAPPGATTTQIWSNGQSKSGSIRTKNNILKVRFDVTDSEASTVEVEQQVPPVTDIRISAPDSPPNGNASRSWNIPQTRINIDRSSQADFVDDSVLAKPVTPGRHMIPGSRTNAPSSRPHRRAFIVKLVDAFGRERIDELPMPIASGPADAEDVICALPSAKTRTRVSSKNKICVIDATGEKVQEDVRERSSVLHHDPPICSTAALAQMRQTLQEWASGLSDEDRPPDNLALKPSYSKELEERSRAARRSRNQLARTLRIESVKECERDLMHKYTKGAEDRSGLLPTITGENIFFHRRDLVWVGVLLQIVFVLAMWRFAHVQAGHLFCATYYDPLYPGLTPRIGGRAWERWAERPNAETWPPT